jgi:HEPN domain-containing protein
MISKKMAENYLADATSILSEAKVAKGSDLHHRAIRLSQESLELSLKAVLRSVGVEYPKEHDVSDAIDENLQKFPDWFRSISPELKEGSEWLSERRGLSMYGDEIAGKPPSQLFTSEDSAKALEYADRAVNIARRLFNELFQTT